MTAPTILLLVSVALASAGTVMLLLADRLVSNSRKLLQQAQKLRIESEEMVKDAQALNDTTLASLLNAPSNKSNVPAPRSVKGDWQNN